MFGTHNLLQSCTVHQQFVFNIPLAQKWAWYIFAHSIFVSVRAGLIDLICPTLALIVYVHALSVVCTYIYRDIS